MTPPLCAIVSNELPLFITVILFLVFVLQSPTRAEPFELVPMNQHGADDMHVTVLLVVVVHFDQQLRIWVVLFVELTSVHYKRCPVRVKSVVKDFTLVDSWSIASLRRITTHTEERIALGTNAKVLLFELEASKLQLVTELHNCRLQVQELGTRDDNPFARVNNMFRGCINLLSAQLVAAAN